MEPLRVNAPYFRIALAGLTALLLGVATFCAPSPADAAHRTARVHNARAALAAPVIRPGPVIVRREIVVEREDSPQVAPGGTVVLRGSRSGIPNTNTGQPTVPALGAVPAFGAGYGSSQPVLPVLAAPLAAGRRGTPGWDHELDTGGTDYAIAPTYNLGR